MTHNDILKTRVYRAANFDPECAIDLRPFFISVQGHYHNLGNELVTGRDVLPQERPETFFGSMSRGCEAAIN